MAQVEIYNLGEYLYGVEKMAQLLVKRHLGKGEFIAEGNALIKKYGLKKIDVLERFVELLEDSL